MTSLKSVKAVCTTDPDPPQATCKDQFIFLLEFYVSYVDSPRLAKLNEMFLVPTTVRFQFLDFEMDDEMQITPVDPMFEPRSGNCCTDYELFYSGRSVLFALGQESVYEMFKEFKIDVKVIKKMPVDIKPDVPVGCGEIDLSILFAALRKELIDKVRYKNADIPDPVKTLEKQVPLYFEDGLVGCMKCFVRISTFGQTVVTAIDPPDMERSSARSFLFRGTDEMCENRFLEYKCRRFDPLQCELSTLLQEESLTCQQKQKEQCPKLPCQPCRIDSGARIKGKSGSPSPTLPTMMFSPGCGGRGEPESTNLCCEQDPPRRPIAGIQTSRAPKEPCGKAVVLKVSGLLGADEESPDPVVTVTGEDEAVTKEELEDPDHDIFVLRIGKKGIVGAGEKSDLQLEMRTPKGLDRRPPVRLETREMQTEDDNGKKGGKKKKK